MGDGRIAEAKVVALKYLNWDCKSKIICKVAEGTVSKGIVNIVEGTPRKIGLVSGDCLVTQLRAHGWTPFRYTKTYRMVLAYNNEVQTARIWLRKNGVDFQVLSDVHAMPRTFSKPSFSITDGRFVRHYLSHTTFNLFEGAFRFAEAFKRNEGAYDRFFISVGQSNRRITDDGDREKIRSVANLGLHDSDGGPDDWRSDWCDGMDSWYSEMMERD